MDLLGIDSLYGLEYGGGFIFHINQIDGTTLVASDYSEFGIIAWGDIFDLDTCLLYTSPSPRDS